MRERHDETMMTECYVSVSEKVAEASVTGERRHFEIFRI